MEQCEALLHRERQKLEAANVPDVFVLEALEVVSEMRDEFRRQYAPVAAIRAAA